LRNRFFLFGLTPDALDADAFAAASCVRWNRQIGQKRNSKLWQSTVGR
jgi:hypothetical protein